MIQQELRKHQRKAFRRHPMFERNRALKVFMYIVFALLGVELLALGFALYEVLVKFGAYNNAIDSMNYLLLYWILFDFFIKYMGKQSQTMQIAPYLALPVKRTTLFNFLLMKEFTNVWNLYAFFFLIPFAFRAIPGYHGYLGVLMYILFFYLLCIGNSLIVNIANNLLKRSGWYFFLPMLFVAAIVGLTFIPYLHIEEAIVKFSQYILNGHIIAWVVFFLGLAGLWMINLSMMNKDIYRAMQGKKTSEASFSFTLPFIDKLGRMGTYINLEIKMIFRSKRMKSQMKLGPVFMVYYILMLWAPGTKDNTFFMVFFTMFILGWVGLIMAQYIFTAESSYFDGLMTWSVSLLDMLKAKYGLYVSYSTLMLLIMIILVFLGRIEFFFLISIFFYTIGFLFFLMFQNAVYNKSFFDHSESGMFNWKGTSANMMLVSMLGIFGPLILVFIIKALFSMTIACYFMLTVGLAFTLTVNYWLKWIYNRFLQRKYKNMEGFRSNT